MIIAGEASGDLHASRLVNSILEQVPKVSFSGMGGTHMDSTGVEILCSYENVSVTGILDGIRVIPDLLKTRSKLLKFALKNKPDIVIFVDFPGFNMNLVKTFKRNLLKSRMIYFIPPQIWGWRPSRAKRIVESFDLLLTIFPFEKDFFGKDNIPVKYIGNPICFELMQKTNTKLTKNYFGIDETHHVIAIIPGSREKELNRHLPHMIDAARILEKKFSKTIFVVSEAKSLPEGIIDSFLTKSEKFIFTYRGELSELLRISDFSIVSSGTASLESSVVGVESILIYKTDFLTYLLAKYFLMRVDYIGLPNLIAGEEVVPELLQRKVNGPEIAKLVENTYVEVGGNKEEKHFITQIRKRLESPDPYKNASKLILKDWVDNAE